MTNGLVNGTTGMESQFGMAFLVDVSLVPSLTFSFAQRLLVLVDPPMFLPISGMCSGLLLILLFLTRTYRPRIYILYILLTL
jgi:hypothetical protein